MKNDGRKGLVYLAYLGFALLAPIIGAMFIGVFLMKKFNWPSWVPMVLMFLGLIGGMRDLYVLIMKDFDDRR
ncbi:MAG: AtpZ/AtpI family protein [Firmicutes bacterium]|nr:AtpZ/AtpI family protein [Bacillota bacterium]MDD4262950.1 AtpZ/AtpI family protein [Bacillota bacterium]MDD4693177.1 AtpZ/AtpI family protein [Bacillota bacterium]